MLDEIEIASPPDGEVLKNWFNFVAAAAGQTLKQITEVKEISAQTLKHISDLKEISSQILSHSTKSNDTIESLNQRIILLEQKLYNTLNTNY